MTPPGGCLPEFPVFWNERVKESQWEHTMSTPMVPDPRPAAAGPDEHCGGSAEAPTPC